MIVNFYDIFPLLLFVHSLMQKQTLVKQQQHAGQFFSIVWEWLRGALSPLESGWELLSEHAAAWPSLGRASFQPRVCVQKFRVTVCGVHRLDVSTDRGVLTWTARIWCLPIWSRQQKRKQLKDSNFTKTLLQMVLCSKWHQMCWEIKGGSIEQRKSEQVTRKSHVFKGVAF